MGHINHNYLRPIKAMRRQIMVDSPFPKRESLQIQTEDNATVLPLRNLQEENLLFGRGGVVDAQGNYVALSAIPQRICGSYSFDNPTYRDEKVVYCGYLAPQWGHFLVESVTRLWYFLENDTSIDSYVFFLDENDDRIITGNFREFLELLGIWDKLSFVSKPTTFRQIVIPEIAFQLQTFYSQKFLDIYDAVVKNVKADPSWKIYDKIYFSRSHLLKFGESTEFGHELLDDLFQKNGYLRIFPESLSLSQTIFYIRNAQTVATLSGSAEHNILFAQNCKHVEVLERCVYNIDYQVDIDRIRDLDITYIDANFPLYTTDIGSGPYIVGYSKPLMQFCQDKGYLPPDPKFLSAQYDKECLARYMDIYWRRYHYHWFMENWYHTCADALWEGYQAGYEHYRPYLDGEKPFRTVQYLSLYYIKQSIKFLLQKLGLFHG